MIASTLVIIPFHLKISSNLIDTMWFLNKTCLRICEVTSQIRVIYFSLNRLIQKSQVDLSQILTPSPFHIVVGLAIHYVVSRLADAPPPPPSIGRNLFTTPYLLSDIFSYSITALEEVFYPELFPKIIPRSNFFLDALLSSN